MKIIFYGGQTAGVVVLLTILAGGHTVSGVIAEDDKVKQIARVFNIKIYNKSIIDDEKFVESLKATSDLFICCHGKKILSKFFVRTIKCVNLHPCLYKYKGTRPIKRLIADNNSKASVGSHFMTENVDKGDVIVEHFISIKNTKDMTETDVYGFLYPLYSSVVINTMKKLSNE